MSNCFAALCPGAWFASLHVPLGLLAVQTEYQDASSKIGRCLVIVLLVQRNTPAEVEMLGHGCGMLNQNHLQWVQELRFISYHIGLALV